ncbi:MAG: tRNA uridine-5-carboxymethylaminomethyl(34) synthesis GTPase MnmE [Flavobacteriales bacterium]|nr:tRNA uridine-5-carboxymethylaminomethyl(34) synthesis GTPase MnmE [Flavobacteriales bacterium]
MEDRDTICAISTPPGMGAVALVRLSGPQAVAITRGIAPGLPHHPAARRAFRVDLHDADGPLDEALCTCFSEPRSYTGEDVVELAVHGSPHIQQRVLEALVTCGARLARPGEFTLRAFLNKKLDLAQAEAVADLIASRTAAAHKLALSQLRGGYSVRIEELRQKLIDLSALIELELDFGEEDVRFAERPELLALLDELSTICDTLIASFRYGNAVRVGVPVAIVGAPNSGKSTLLNALLGEERAIVSEIPGTTRDTVEETLVLDGITFRFIDTAGLRETEDAIEQLGIERSYRKAAEAEVVLLLGDATTMTPDELKDEAQRLRLKVGAEPIPVLNKTDLARASHPGMLAISARTGTGLDALRERLVAQVKQTEPGDIVVTNVRHVEALRHAHDALRAARVGILGEHGGELIAADLRRAQHHLGEITGRITPDDLLGSIFGRFCIGK